MSTLKCTYIQQASSASPNITLDASTNATVAGTLAMGSSFKRNRIINGNMVVDQRNAGAAVNGNGGTLTYPVDRFYSQLYGTTGNTTGQQSSVAPADFTNSLRITVQTADSSLGASDAVWYGQNVEGYNVADFNLGSATNARTFTVSFWVYSNVTGTYCICIKNSAENRAYVAEYTISASATWEKKTITIAGDTTGTWLTTNGTGMKVLFALMAGSSYQTTANVWSAGTGGVFATSNQVNFMSSTSNYWQVTGVQLETGSIATPYERQIYSDQLAQCQRYYYRITSSGTSFSMFGPSWSETTTFATGQIRFPVTMRTRPTALEQTGTAANYAVLTGSSSVTCSSVPVYLPYTNSDVGCCYFTVASGLTAGQGTALVSGNGVAAAYLGWSAEL